MTLPKLRTEQHAQILGYAIIGYGVSFLIDLIDPLAKLFSLTSILSKVDSPAVRESIRPVSTALTDSVWPGVVYGVAAFGLSVSAGIVIKRMDTNPKPVGLAFAILVFGLFPLGTLISVYTLIFLFAIYEQEGASGFAKLDL